MTLTVFMALIQALQQSGFFSEDEIDIQGKKIKPIDLTSKILFDQWKLMPSDEEFTIMTVLIKGKKNNEDITVEYLLFDEYDAETQTASMSRTTAYTCTAAVNLLAQKLFDEKGVFPPELVGKHKICFDFILNYLANRKVIYKKTMR